MYTKPEFASAQYTAGELNAVVKLLRKHGGKNGVERFLRGEFTVNAPICNLPIWKTIKLGTKKNVEEYREALQSSGYGITDRAKYIISEPGFTCALEVLDVDLVVLSVADLDFKRGASYHKICARALEMKLELCSAEVGPALCLAYGDQPKDEWLRIAMEAIIGSDSSRRIFALAHCYNGLRFCADYGYADEFHEADQRFVFVRPRSQS